LLATVVLGFSPLRIARAEKTRALSYDVRLEPLLTALGGAFWITSELLKPKLAPEACRWCDDNALDRGAREALRWSNTSAAAHTSDALGFGLVPAFAFGGVVGAAALDDSLGGSWKDAAIVLESAVVAADLTQLIKFSLGRERPFVHALGAAEKSDERHPADNNLSFFSGHSSFTFSLATSAAMVATLRGYRIAPILWSVGPALAAFTGYLRIAADKHYLSDVLVGAAVGTATGVLIPWLHARGDRDGVRASVAPSQLVLTFQH
jgi:membrane-associated phospholipid phosphatase